MKAQLSPFLPSPVVWWGHEKGIVHSVVDHSLNWKPEDSALLLINCMTLDKSFAFSLVMHEIDIPSHVRMVRLKVMSVLCKLYSARQSNDISEHHYYYLNNNNYQSKGMQLQRSSRI